ncbi:MAG: hypothetical protein R3C44_23345 [Chloroflexota bacterium]
MEQHAVTVQPQQREVAGEGIWLPGNFLHAAKGSFVTLVGRPSDQ